MNSGYVGYSRSVRSSSSIINHEMPLSLITKSRINLFLEDHEEIFSSDDMDYLKSLSVAKWKYFSKESGQSSWHHTGTYFNKTDHYSLLDTADHVLENIEQSEDRYKAHIESLRDKKNNEINNTVFGVLEVQIWGGSRKRPVLQGTEKQVGIVIGDWLYYKNYQDSNRPIKKLKTKANKVVSFTTYKSYNELVKSNKEFTATKRYFNSIINKEGK